MSIRLPNPRALLALAALLASGTLQISAYAEPSQSDLVIARTLFDRGKELMAAGQIEEACGKFAESQKLDPRSGTLLNLATCREAQGKTATAWLLFKESLTMARRDGRPDREELARSRIAALEPILSRLTLHVQMPAVGIEVVLDGRTVGRAAWGEAMPVDPGEHEVLARAPARKTWTTRVSVLEKADNKSIEIPPLDPEPGAVAQPSATTSATTPPVIPTASASSSEPPKSANRTATYLLFGGSAVALGVGAFLGLKASSSWDDAQSHCVNGVCDAEAESLSRRANNLAWGTNAALGIGVLLAGAGVWTLVAPSSSSPRATARTQVQASPLGVSLRGAW